MNKQDWIEKFREEFSYEFENEAQKLDLRREDIEDFISNMYDYFAASTIAGCNGTTIICTGLNCRVCRKPRSTEK